MKRVRPSVFKIGETRIDPKAVAEVMQVLGVSLEASDRFISSRGTDGQALIEFAGRMCYDAHTEVLTSGGWRPGMDLSGSEMIATWNGQSRVVEYQPHKPWKYHYRGKMLSIDHQHVSLVVTPEHRMYVQPRRGEYGIVEARDLGSYPYRFLLAGSTIHGEPKSSFDVAPAEVSQTIANQYGTYGVRTRTIGGLAIPSGPYLKLAGYYLSEGHTYGQPGSGAGIGLTQKEGPVFQDMITTVREAKLPLGLYRDPRNPPVRFLHVGGGRALVSHFKKFGRGARNKMIPREIMALDPSSLRTLYNAMWMGDGHATASGGKIYNTTSEQLADDVQELLLRLGVASCIHSYPLNGRPFYIVRELPVRHSPVVYSKHRRWVPYDGPVWCISTGNGIVMVRRNKKAVWCGNCYESYEPGLNPNVTKIRESPEAYMRNILSRGDGSILEHGLLNFAVVGISRVASHELVRHRVGTAVSQESFRYVRPREIGFWVPDELDSNQKDAMIKAVEKTEEAYRELEGNVPWDTLPMDAKKRLTSALRRILPQGMTTNLVWSANHRTIRWVIEMRTDPSAEVEIRMVFDQVAQICKRDYPTIYSDMERSELPDGTGSWRPTLRSKV